jgi:hypothetical protein
MVLEFWRKTWKIRFNAWFKWNETLSSKMNLILFFALILQISASNATISNEVMQMRIAVWRRHAMGLKVRGARCEWVWGERVFLERAKTLERVVHAPSLAATQRVQIAIIDAAARARRRAAQEGRRTLFGHGNGVSLSRGVYLEKSLFLHLRWREMQRQKWVMNAALFTPMHHFSLRFSAPIV